MIDIPQWKNVKDDPQLQEAFEEADQITGEGLLDLLHQMIRVGNQTGARAFFWIKDTDQEAKQDDQA